MIPTSVRQPSADNPLYGSCLCGGVRFEVTAPFVWASHCHCSRCRKHSGAFGETQGRVPREGFRLLQGEELISVYRPEDGRVKAFCSVCGSSLFGNEWPEGDQIGIRLGALDGDPGIRPSFHTFVGLEGALGATPGRRAAALRRRGQLEPARARLVGVEILAHELPLELAAHVEPRLGLLVPFVFAERVVRLGRTPEVADAVEPAHRLKRNRRPRRALARHLVRLPSRP